ncbi:hypothetical protein [Synechococcus sp. CCY9202]|uniref:hypothetical protein n=1 Tax=Synechococcus sp. CCY9202 TaxID=174698 RepID=UPI002B20E4DB|nr:hypothetical protein [Synechococcus sp. CCY9202]MEA5423948.1 hypothetical protein [Synechococcus sp. CCY9202]
MAHLLVFVVAPEALLPGDGADWPSLVEAQRRGVGSGVALRLFRLPDDWPGSLQALIDSGKADATGSDPIEPVDGRRSRLCDAVVPHFDPRSLWIGVYAISGSAFSDNEVSDNEVSDRQVSTSVPVPGDGHPASRMSISGVERLDAFPLRDAENETCWFYPTEDGAYLSWENQRRLELLPGVMAEQPLQTQPIPYQRPDLHVLWSLMADDRSLTCVGLTYGRRRIDWLVVAAVPEACATWTSFSLDSMAEAQYCELASCTVFAQDGPGAVPGAVR